MSCKEFEQHIYLYNELSADERELLDAHLQTCVSCTTLIEEVKAAQLTIKRIAGEEIVPPNAARLTSGIMAKISSERETGKRSLFILPIFGQARVALTVLSIFLLVTFAIEFLRDSSHLQYAENLTVANSVVLNSKIFRENFSQGKARHSLVAECGRPLKMNINCLRSKLK